MPGLTVPAFPWVVDLPGLFSYIRCKEWEDRDTG